MGMEDAVSIGRIAGFATLKSSCFALASCAQARLPAPPGANRSLRRFTCPQVQTDRMGDIHHYAWRARHRNQTVYITKRDAQRFGDWPSLQVRGM